MGLAMVIVDVRATVVGVLFLSERCRPTWPKRDYVLDFDFHNILSIALRHMTVDSRRRGIGWKRHSAASVEYPRLVGILSKVRDRSETLKSKTVCEFDDFVQQSIRLDCRGIAHVK